MKEAYIYILASQRNGTLYVGVTTDLQKRTWQHKEKVADGFTKKYTVKKLVYYEVFADVSDAIHREKRPKKYTRKAKLNLIEKDNPDWTDLYEKICA